MVAETFDPQGTFRVLQQERLLLLQTLRELVHRLLVAALVQLGEGGNRASDVFGGNNVRGHGDEIFSAEGRNSSQRAS